MDRSNNQGRTDGRAPEGGPFGPNQLRVAAPLMRIAAEQPFDWESGERAAAEFAQAVADLPGTGSPEERVIALAADLRRHAEELDPRMFTHVLAAIARELDVRIVVNVPPAQAHQVRNVVESALLWPAVFGAHPNPLAAVVDLVRMNVFPSVEGKQLLVYHSLLARPVNLPPPTPKAPSLTIVRDISV